MVPVTSTWIAEALARLRSDVAAGNTSGNVDGLLARHIIAADPRLGIVWGIDCEEVWLHRSYDPSSLPTVAALGYTVERHPKPVLLNALEDGMQRATARDPAIAGPGAALHDPAVLIGLALAARRFKGTKNQYVVWMSEVIRGLHRANVPRIDPLLAYAARLCELELGQPTLEVNAPLNYCASLDWWLDNGAPRDFFGAEQRLALRAAVVERSLTENLGRHAAYQAALQWRVLREAVSEETSIALRTPHTVSHVLDKFESCVRRWRWDAVELKSPVRWPIRSEREVQDILWVILRSLFHDLEDEDTLPKFGHSSYKADLGIPSLGLLIEVKFARSAADFKSIEKEILEDIVPYLRSPERYREVLVFIYDDSCSVQEHDTTRRALRSVQGVADVLVVSRPSQLPPAAQQSDPDRRVAKKPKQ